MIMPEAVSLGTAYTVVELRLGEFNKQYDQFIAKLGEMQKKLDGLHFSPAKIATGAESASKVFAVLTDSLTRAGSAIEKLNKTELNVTGILRGADQATRALIELSDRAGLTSQRILDLSAKSVEAQGSLRGLGTQAAGAEKKVGALAATGDAAATSVANVGNAGLDAGAGLELLGDGAAAAKTGVSALGRVATLTLPKIEALSGAKFDPAGIEAGTAAGTRALERLRLAAQSVRDSLRMAPPMIGMGGRVGAGGGVTGAGATALRGGNRIQTASRIAQFGGGMRVGVGAAMDVAGASAALLTIGAALTGKAASDFDNKLAGIVHNTTMKPEEAKRLRGLILQKMRTGTTAEELGAGYAHAVNLDYHGKDAENILAEGNRLGIATHAPVGETTNIIASVMRDYNMPGSKARSATEMLHLTSAGGNSLMHDFEKFAGKAFGTGANNGVSMPEVAAALQAMTQHSFNNARASTQFVGMVRSNYQPDKKSEGHG